MNTGALTYLPGVVGEIVAHRHRWLLVRVRAARQPGAAPAELDLWSAGPGGGSVTPVTQLPGRTLNPRVEPVRMSSDGSVLVFTTDAIAGLQQRWRRTDLSL